MYLYIILTHSRMHAPRAGTQSERLVCCDMIQVHEYIYIYICIYIYIFIYRQTHIPDRLGRSCRLCHGTRKSEAGGTLLRVIVSLHEHMATCSVDLASASSAPAGAGPARASVSMVHVSVCIYIYAQEYMRTHSRDLDKTW